MSVSYCINPKCQHPENPEQLDYCQACKTPLLINDRYRLIKPLRAPNPAHPTEIFEVEDWGKGEEEWGTVKVLKVLKYSNNPDLIRLFKQEARALIWLRHPGIPKVEPDGYFIFDDSHIRQELHCLVMEKITGENLDKWLNQQGKISQPEALEWLEQLVNILDLIHSQNLLHRDIKPANIIVRPNGQLVIVDFGTVGVGDWGNTQVGSLGYAAPEQIIGEAVLQSDFFALGRTFVHLLTGRPPIDFPTNAKSGKLNWRNQAPQISNYFADFIDELMVANPQKRPKNTKFILKRLATLNHNSKVNKKFFYPLKIQLIAWLLLGLIGSRFLLPKLNNFWYEYALPNLALSVNKVGVDNFKNNQLASAEFYFRLALMLDKSNSKARYNLGWVCEERDKFDCAETEYLVAMENDNPRVATRAINNLARLKILDGKYSLALDLLQQGLTIAEHPFVEEAVKSDLYKNLGWVYFQQEKYTLAASHFKQAIALDKKNTPAHCLLAQVQELEAKKITALPTWKNCLDLSPGWNPETKVWQSMARQRLYQE